MRVWGIEIQAPASEELEQNRNNPRWSAHSPECLRGGFKEITTLNTTHVSQTVHITSIQKRVFSRVTRACVREDSLLPPPPQRSCCRLAVAWDIRGRDGQRGAAWSVYILNWETERGEKSGAWEGSGRIVLCSLRFEGTVLSHDVHKELAGIAHGMLEGLATGGELRGHGC